MLKNYIPNFHYQNIYQIDYNKMYEKGYRYLFFDLDNTLISYDETKPTNENMLLFSNLKNLGFQIIIVSNSVKKRVKKYANLANLEYISFSMKPFSRGFKKAIKKLKIKKENINLICEIGDQMMTDVYGSNKMGFTSVLVDPIKIKTEKFFTRFNRKRELKIKNKLKKKYNDLYINNLCGYKSI